MEKYIYIICPITTLIICQIIKFTIEGIQNKKINWSRLFNGAGGMPSSHTSFSFSLTMLIGYNIGFDNPLFAICLIFSFIIAYDSMGLRLESERQAQAINVLFENIGKGKIKNNFKKLKEELGHQPVEVLMGILLGTTTALVFSIFL